MWYKIKLAIERWKKGYTDAEVWNLDAAFCSYLIPRLKRYKELNMGVPQQFLERHGEDAAKRWDEVIDKIIIACELHLDDLNDEYERQQEGFALLGKYLPHLWS